MGGYSDIGKKKPQKWWSSILAIQENKVLCKNHKVPFKKEKKIVKKNKQFLLLTNLAKRLIGLQVIWFIFHPWSLKKKCHISKQPTKPSQSLFFLALALIRYSVFVFFVCFAVNDKNGKQQNVYWLWKLPTTSRWPLQNMGEFLLYPKRG